MNKPPYGNQIRQFDLSEQFKVTAQNTPNRTVKVAAGVFTTSKGIITEFSGGNSPAFITPKTSNQWCLISVGTSGDIDLEYHVSVPTVRKDRIACALLYLTSAHTMITNDMIFDIRGIYSPHSNPIDHTDLSNTNISDLHPISSITGLEAALLEKISIADVDTRISNKADLDGTSSHVFTLNKDSFGLPASDIKLEVNRGSELPVAIKWNEIKGFWEYTNDGVNWLGFDNSGFIDVASDTVSGLVRLSVFAADPSVPTVVGDNDPRVFTTAEKTNTLAHLTNLSDPHHTLKDDVIEYSYLKQTTIDRLVTKTNGEIIDSLTINTPTVTAPFILGTNNQNQLVVGLNSSLLNGKSDSAFSLTTHNHDTVYSLLTHNHDSVYSLLNHNHDLVYAPIVHNHDLVYSHLNHNHDSTYSLLTHNHNLLYADIGHLHDTRYSLLTHNHDSAYAPLNHTHDYSAVYAAIDHNHDLIYSMKNHKHDELYAPIAHNHDLVYAKKNGVFGTFTTVDGKTITIEDGIVTAIA